MSDDVGVSSVWHDTLSLNNLISVTSDGHQVQNVVNYIILSTKFYYCKLSTTIFKN